LDRKDLRVLLAQLAQLVQQAQLERVGLEQQVQLEALE
jgi:hypothetical protein